MDFKLEVLVLPVSDVDRAKAFYEKLGFRLDIDYVAYATHHFDRLSTTMADPRFDDWLETVRGN